MRVFLESLSFEIEMRVSQKSAEQSHDVAPSLYSTAISMDSPHIRKDGSNYLNLLLEPECKYVKTWSMVSPCFYFSQIIPSGKVTHPIILTTVWTTVWSCLLKPELRSRTNMFIRSLKEGTKSGDHWTKIRGQNQKPAPGLVASATDSIENYLYSMRKFRGF